MCGDSILKVKHIFIVFFIISFIILLIVAFRIA